MPCYGTIAALHEVDSRCTHGSGSIQPRPPADQPQNSVRIQFTYSLDSSAHIDAFESGLMQTWEKWQDALKINVRDANTIIRKRRAELANDIRPLIEARQRRVIALRTASANLAIPLSPNLAPSVSIPLKANLLTLERIEQQADSGTPEPALANNLADDVLNIILGFTNALERLHTTADRLAGADEETLRDVLLFVLNANFTGIATGETFTGKGKTDILLRWRDRNAFIAECKFWTGTKKFVEAIDQLLGYTVWRDTRIALILFVRDRRDVSAIITKAVKAILQHPQIISGDEVGEIDNQREFILASTSDSKRAIRLAFIPVHLPTLRSGQTLDEITTP
ncbi:hypothetical protein EV186_1011886 [Labedaea rhizosphaerae]|uniref:Uncharacterized protein n=1 Tax=Labedaea rhizosphaerae TaxID=598644 RepID=A0A4R6SNH4_LABRH|nr:hypothetical protein EV186_1011886 [Labedaea rhizosphaerae]